MESRSHFRASGDGNNGIVDQFEPPLPPHIKTQQAIHFAEALARGETNRGRIALTAFRNKWLEYTER